MQFLARPFFSLEHMEQMEQYLKSISYKGFLFHDVPQCSTMFHCSIVP